MINGYRSSQSKIKNKGLQDKLKASISLNNLYYAQSTDEKQRNLGTHKSPKTTKNVRSDRASSTNLGSQTPANKTINPFYIRKSEKKLTVPNEPRLSTANRASRRESCNKLNNSFTGGGSETSLKRGKEDGKYSKSIHYINHISIENLFGSTINHTPTRTLLKSPSLPCYMTPASGKALLPKHPQSNKNLKNSTIKSSMVKYQSNVPQNNDKNHEILERLMKAEQRKVCVLDFNGLLKLYYRHIMN